MGRWFATICVLCALVMAGARVVSAQDSVPLRDDDLDYAKKLTAAGFEDLAVDLFERILAKPGLTPKQRQEIGQLLVGAYGSLATKTADPAESARYMELANQKLKEFGGEAPSPEVQYQKAQLLQQKGLLISRNLKTEQNADRQKAMIAEAAKCFDECMSILDAIAKDQNTRADLAGKAAVDMDKRIEVEAPFREMALKAEHQRAWTAHYKAQIYPSDSEDYRTGLKQAVQLFGGFADAHPTAMLMLFARNGRGMAYRLLGEKENAQKDFLEVVTIIREHADTVAAVLPLKARCAFQWAELAAELGQADEALAAVDLEIKENASLEADPTLMGQALLTKAKAYAAKARKGGAGAADDWKKAIGLLQDAIGKPGPAAYEARELLPRYVADSGARDLGPEERLALAESRMMSAADAKDPEVKRTEYKQAIDELVQIVDNPPPNMDTLTAFKAQRMLAVAYRLTGQHPLAVKQFEPLFQRFGAKVPKEELAKAMHEYCFTLGQIAKKNPADKSAEAAYVAGWKRLASEYPETPEGLNAKYFHALSLQGRAGTEDGWKEAANAFAEVSPDSAYYGKARYLEGLCWYNIYKVYAQKKDAKNPAAQEALAKALETLKALFDKLPPLKPGDDWHVEAASMLAGIYIDLNQPAEAQGVVEMVQKKFPEQAGADPRLIGKMVEIYVRLGKLDEAATLLEQMAKANAEPAALMRGYVSLGDACQKRGEEARKAGKTADVKKDFARAAEMYQKALPLSENQLKFLKWLAVRAYQVEGYETCIDAIARIEEVYRNGNLPEDSELWQYRVQMARCYEKLNHWPDEGLKLLEKLEKKIPGSAQIKKLRGSVLMTKGQWEEALKVWDEMAPALPAGSEDWWDVQYNRALSNFKLGRKAKAVEIIDGHRAVDPNLKTPANKERFDKLQKEMK